MKTYVELCKMTTEELRKEPCRCVLCGECNGTGNVRIDDWSQPEGYDLDTCDGCRGGIVEVCDRCQLLDELEPEEYL